MVLGDVEETTTVVEIDEETMEEIMKVLFDADYKYLHQAQPVVPFLGD